MRQLYVYVANESTWRLVINGMNTGLTNTHTACGYPWSVSRVRSKTKKAPSVLHYVIKVTLHYLMYHRIEIHSALELSRTALLGCPLTIERVSFTFTSNGKREFVPRDQVSPLLAVLCPLFSSFTQFFIRKNYFELFLSVHFLFWEILNLNLTFAVCRIREV